nr:MAG TPA: hypothetical protein [Caudoviricetes sp.]
MGLVIPRAIDGQHLAGLNIDDHAILYALFHHLITNHRRILAQEPANLATRGFAIQPYAIQPTSAINLDHQRIIGEHTHAAFIDRDTALSTRVVFQRNNHRFNLFHSGCYPLITRIVYTLFAFMSIINLRWQPPNVFA